MQTQERAEWVIELLRTHDAFREGDFAIEAVDPAHPHMGRYRVLYSGPFIHRGLSLGMEPLDVEGEFFAERADAERACVEVRREIPAGQLNAVHVERKTDSGPWYLLWVHAAVLHPGDPQPRTPPRP
jgi:hypothetical protein